MRLIRTTLFVVVLAVIAGVGVAIWRGSGPLPDPEGCVATVADRAVGLDTEQAEVASLVAAIGVRRGLPARAVSIALATGYQESKLRNLAHGDRDSIGIFQQRPSQGWGTVAQIRNPVYATNKFYDALVQVEGYEEKRITDAAQEVQRSGFPEAYEDHAPDARALASALTGYSPAKFSCVVHADDEQGTAARVTRALTTAYGTLDVSRGPRQDVIVTVPGGPSGKRLGWSVAQYAVAHADRLHLREVSFAGRHWQAGRPSEKGWTKTPTPDRRVTISLG